MKKFALVFLLILLLATFLIGCGKTQEQTVDEPITFEELVAANSYDHILSAYENMYIKYVCTDVVADQGYKEEVFLFPGNNKVDYHMRKTMDAGNEISEDLSRVGSEWYYYTSVSPQMALLEDGEPYFLDSTLPELFRCTAIGKAYGDGDFIVQHAYRIYDGGEEGDSRRNDYTYYFDKESKRLVKFTETLYDNQHKVLATYVADLTYGVDINSVFDETMIDKVYNSDKRIDLEVIVGYNTEDQKSYSLVATTDSQVLATISGTTYVFYADPEYMNRVNTLDEYAGEKSLTLYAKPLEDFID